MQKGNERHVTSKHNHCKRFLGFSFKCLFEEGWTAEMLLNQVAPVRSSAHCSHSVLY